LHIYVLYSRLIVSQPGAAIAPIRSALLQLDSYSGTFTTVHLAFVRLCLEARSYLAALPILDNYIYSLPQLIPKTLIELEGSVPCAETANSSDFITMRSGHSEKIYLADLHEYYMLGSLAYIGARRFKQALLFLEHILITPAANIANGIMLEAYKKWVLVGCLVNGAVMFHTRRG
jgi:COP9 signalosome complex subunit 3